MFHSVSLSRSLSALGIFCVLAAASLSPPAVAVEGGPPGLLSAAPSSLQPLAEDSLNFANNADITLEALVVELNPEALEWIPNPNDDALHLADLTSEFAPLSGGRFTLALTPEFAPTVMVDRIASHVPGVTGYVGHLAGNPYSFVTLSLSKRGLEGLVDTTQARYAIEPLATAVGHPAGLYVVRKLDLQALARLSGSDDLVSIGIKSHKTAGKTGVSNPPFARTSTDFHTSLATKSHTSGHVGIMVLYTPAVDNEPGDVIALVNNTISTMNQALNNTGGVSHNVYLAHTQEVSYTSSGSRSTDINRMENSTDGYLDDYLPDIVGTWGADITVLITDDDAYAFPGGVAWPCQSAPPHYALVADDWALSDYTFPHEVGHVLYGKHQHPETNPCDTTGFGYESTSNNWRTLMAICSGTGMCTTRQLFFSNPNLTFMSEARGVPAGQPKPADMHDTLNASMPIASGWETDPPAPGKPSSLDVEPLLCFGSNLVSWTPASGDVGEYRLYLSSSPNFTSQVLVYVGDGQSTSVNIGSGQDPSYLRIKACNGGGCSGYRVGDEPATYTYPCQ